jgi:hypothetical protein
VGYTDRYTDTDEYIDTDGYEATDGYIERQQGDLISFLSFFQNNEQRLKMENNRNWVCGCGLRSAVYRYGPTEGFYEYSNVPLGPRM